MPDLPIDFQNHIRIKHMNTYGICLRNVLSDKTNICFENITRLKKLTVAYLFKK